MQSFELGVLDFIQRTVKCRLLDITMPIISALGNGGFIWILVATLFIMKQETTVIGIQMILAVGFGLIVGNFMMKNLFRRQRPFTARENHFLLIAKPNDFSFPSGHTLASFEAAITIFLFNKAVGTWALVLASLIAFSRMYLYVHYPSDIVAGVVLGIIIASITHYGIHY